jgi:prolyl oligopeptidase PreP (S9A serine peptidase family)
MENEITIQTVKKQVNENNELIGYLVDDTKSVPLAEGNRDYQEVQKYIEDGGIVEEAYTAEELEAIELAKLLEIKAKEKAKIQDIINKSTVTTAAGNVFDANLESRVNMADAILASETLGQTETVWRLADNSEITVDIAELREAHALALQSYAQIKAIGTSK